MRQVAAQAGVSRTSVQLRWSSKAEMVLHAILGDTLELAPFTGTNRAAWIAWVVEGSHHIFDRPEVRAALPGLLLALQHDEALRTGIWRGFSDPAASLYDTDEAEADAARQDAQAILILAAGAALFSSVIAVEDDTPMLRARMVEILSRPPSGKGPG